MRSTAGGIRCVSNVAVKIRGEVEVKSRLHPVNVAGRERRKIVARNGADGHTVRFADVKHQYGGRMSKECQHEFTDIAVCVHCGCDTDGHILSGHTEPKGQGGLVAEFILRREPMTKSH